MEARLLKAFIVSLALIFAIPTASAMNLGTLQKSSDASIASGETAAFRTLFWSTDREQYTVTINYTKVPAGWIVIALPKQFVLGGAQTGKTERIYLPGTKSTVDAEAVDIYITAPEKAVSGKYEIVLDAIAGNTKDTGFSLFQERELRFSINLSGKSAQDYEKNDSRTTFISISPAIGESRPEKTQAGQGIPETLPDEGKGWVLPLTMIAVISIIAWRLYKYD